MPPAERYTPMRVIPMLAATLALFVAIVGNITIYTINHRTEISTKKIHKALCGFRQDLKSQADNTQEILDSHPHLQEIKIGELTFTRTDLKNSVKRQNSVVKALGLDDCDSPVKPKK